MPRRRSRDAFAGDQRLGALHAFDAMAALDSPVHRLDPRAKLLATFAFIVVVMSFDRYELRALLPFALYPVALFGLAGLPARPILLTMLLASPFAVMVGLANPIFDRAPIASAMGFEISGGWVSFASVLVRFALTVGAALLLVATTGMYRVCMALERLLVPRIFVLQLLFVYRYVFVLADEAASISRAVRLRSFGQPTTIALFGRLAGALLLRTLDRAQRIHRAMVARGFDGRIRFLGNLTLRPADAAFLVATTAAFAALRSIDGPALLGRLLLGGRT